MSDDHLARALDELAFAAMCFALNEQEVDGDDSSDLPPSLAAVADQVPPGLQSVVERLGRARSS